VSQPPLTDSVIGHGTHRYRVHRDWVRPTRSTPPVLNCHEMVRSRDGRLFLCGDHPQHQLLIFTQGGDFLESWGAGWPGAHGLTLGEDLHTGDEFLLLSDSGCWLTGERWFNQSGRVVKLDLSGRELFTLGHPVTVGAYTAEMPFHPTETAVAPNGDLYVADGYGSHRILRYNRHGQFLSTFGGPNPTPDSPALREPHGIAVDLRKGPENATLLVTSRKDHCFHRFTLEGRYLETIHLPGAYVCRAVFHGSELYAGVCWSDDDTGNFQPGPSGFLVVLDDSNRLISAPGAHDPGPPDSPKKTLRGTGNLFEHVHDVCPLDNGDLIVCQWNAHQTYPIRLERC
jgi:hypothetical protein